MANKLDFYLGSTHYLMEFDEQATGYLDAVAQCNAKDMTLLSMMETNENGDYDPKAIYNQLMTITHLGTCFISLHCK